METTKNKPLASPKEDTLVGNGMSKREARKIWSTEECICFEKRLPE